MHTFSSILITGVLQQASSCLDFPSALRSYMVQIKSWMSNCLVTYEVPYQCVLVTAPFIPHVTKGLIANNHRDLVSCCPLPPPEEFRSRDLHHHGQSECPVLFLCTAWVCRKQIQCHASCSVKAHALRKPPCCATAIESSCVQSYH